MGAVIAEFSVIPLGLKETSLSKYVAEAIKIVKDSGIKYQLTPMGTILEDDSLERILSVIQRVHNALFELGIPRLLTRISIDERRDVSRTMESKVESVLRRLES